MRIPRTALLLLILAFFGVAAYAQEAGPPGIEAKTDINVNPYVKGEQTLAFSLGGFFPTPFIDLYAGGTADTNLNVGAAFGLSYSYVISQGFSIGGDISGATCSTTAESSFFMVPFTFKTAWYFVKMPFEIVPSVSAGVNIVRYESYTHFDPILKAGAAFLWRQSSSWSFGIDAQAWTVWQLYFSEPEYDRLGIFIDARAIAVYHL